MNKYTFIRLIICLCLFGVMGYFYLNKQHRLTRMQIAIPKLEKELKILKEENIRLSYHISEQENPKNLLAMAKKGEFSHLRHPQSGEVVILSSGMALEGPQESIPTKYHKITPKSTFAAKTQ